MNITEFSVRNRVVTWLAALLIIVGGVISYNGLGKLEDPEFTIKSAIVVTSYNGASPTEVEKQVTEPIEIAIQEIPELDYVESISTQDRSIVKVNIKSKYWSDKLPQIWDTLRRKVNDVESSLPQGASKPIVADDFGDVYGFVLAITGDGYSYDDLEKEAKNIKRKLSLVKGVSRIEFWGKQQQGIYLKVKEDKLSEMGITLNDIAQTIGSQNTITYAGNIYNNQIMSRIEVPGNFINPEDIAELTITGKTFQGNLIKIKDVVNVEKDFVEPSTETMRYNGKQAIGLAISNIEGSNVIDLGENLNKEIERLQPEIPVGINIHQVSWQADQVGKAINDFMMSLIESVLIVLVVLTIAMGWNMGVIIGTALILTITGTMILLSLLGIDLHRVSLGALIIALGMMVDNSIVVGEGITIRLLKGMDRVKAVIEAATQPSMALLGATLIAILAFYPIGGSSEDVGEYCLSLFQVVGISLLISLIVSLTVTPVQCLYMLKIKPTSDDVYKSPFFQHYKKFLQLAIKYRVMAVIIMVALLIFSAMNFSNIKQMFFPSSSRPQFMVDMYAPNGSRVTYTSDVLKKAEDKIMKMPGIKNVSTFIGSGPPRFYLPVEPELFYPSYGQLIVNVNDYRDIDGIIAQLDPWLAENFPEIPTFRTIKYAVGPGDIWKFEVRINAPQDASLDDIREVGENALALIKNNPLVEASRLNWREKAPKVVVDYDQNQGRWTQISRNDLLGATSRAFDGKLVGEFRDEDNLLPILIRNNNEERNNPSSIYNIQIPQVATSKNVPISQVTDRIDVEWENPIIWRRDRHRTITVQASPIKGVTLPTLRNTVIQDFNKFEKNLPIGYSMEWGAETESSADAQASLVPGIGPALVLMFFIVVCLFNGLKPAFIIFLTIPLAIIGIVWGLLATGATFGFMALLGGISLVGMMIKNAVVLLDEVKININERHQDSYDAIINAGLSRLRPVFLASATTVLALIPLLNDVFWQSMSVAIMAGLTFGTLLTIVFVPVLYTFFYKVRKE